jgi:hypothetical protein
VEAVPVPLAHDEITAISSEVIQSYPNEPFEFVGVMASEGGSGRVEVMVTIKGCHKEPCRLRVLVAGKFRGRRETASALY